MLVAEKQSKFITSNKHLYGLNTKSSQPIISVKSRLKAVVSTIWGENEYRRIMVYVCTLYYLIIIMVNFELLLKMTVSGEKYCITLKSGT